MIRAAGHDLEVSVPPTAIPVSGDAVRLTQVFTNLLTNACKYTNNGGRIALTLERSDEHALIRVCDNGIGIASDKIPLIFDMFMQVDSSLDRSVSGLGLGLTLVKTLVEMHNGTVEAHSAGLGQGSEFVIRLPLSSTPPSAPAPESPPPGHTIARRRILVVDDNRDSAASLSLLLKLSGHETFTVHDGIAAVTAANTIRPDVILMDIGLPKMNGYEAALRIRQEPWGMNMVLVAVSGYGQEQDRRRSAEVGFDTHMVKPVDISLLSRFLAGVFTKGL
jgi:CheY-like chemotaxis protein